MREKWFAVDIGVVVSSVISLLSFAELSGKGEMQLNDSGSIQLWFFTVPKITPIFLLKVELSEVISRFKIVHIPSNRVAVV